MSAKFGPAGNSDAFSAVHKSSLAAPQWIAEQGLDCYEYQCGKGVHVGEDTARRVGENARKHGISLSLHAPYFINLANPDPDSLQKTIGYITSACLVASQMGASRVVIHPGALMKRTRREALDTALRSLREVIRTCDGQGFGHIALCPETMGKINQLGDLEEVLGFCELDERFTPCIDFGHLNSRTHGGLEEPGAYEAVLDVISNRLGEERGKRFHMHFSKIEYSAGGEKVHLTFESAAFGPDPAPLMALLARRGLEPVCICESAGTQAEDAAEMKRLYRESL